MDPALVQALDVVWYNGHRDAWARDGGTYSRTRTRPGDPVFPETDVAFALDVTAHRWSETYSSEAGPYNAQLPSRDVFIGHTRYHHTAPALKPALRLHHVPHPAWTTTPLSATRARNTYPNTLGIGSDGAITPASGQEQWQTLSVTSDPNGNKTYTGSYREEVGGTTAAPTYYTPQVTVHVDPQNRPVSWEESGPYPATDTYERDSTATSHETWQWARPHIAKPKASAAARPGIVAEKHAWSSAEGMAEAANDRQLFRHKPVTAHYLQARFGAKRYHTTAIAKGVRLVLHGAGHTLTWKVVVRGDLAVYKPTHN